MNSYSFNYTSDGAFFDSAVFNTVNVKRQKNVPIIFKTNKTFHIINSNLLMMYLT